ncbi:protein FD-like isoform X1 [Canna indica]|uniref:Protein FD-like isoform X1 n=1 Tax=Canna indica TaxID=4628 RepID=A0AAQ3JMT2_9LILI|nr:protein FD-like isoform X1 [Canna indica]
MEEVWKDLSLTSLQQDTPSTPILSQAHHELKSLHGGAASFTGTTLQDFLTAGHFKETNPPSQHRSSALNGKQAPEKRQLHQESGDVVDRRKKRMIKNRESAARSRARKQAYTHELEEEVDNLERENKKLKRQNEELKKAMADQVSLATNRTLQRTLTAPF